MIASYKPTFAKYLGPPSEEQEIKDKLFTTWEISDHSGPLFSFPQLFAN